MPVKIRASRRGVTVTGAYPNPFRTPAAPRGQGLLQIPRIGSDRAGVMVANPMPGQTNDDPRRLRGLLDRACDLAREHAVPSVMLGLAGEVGDSSFPEFVVFLQSCLLYTSPSPRDS